MMTPACERSLCSGSWPRSLTDNHRRPAVDYLIAAAAELAGDDIVLWFFGKDLRVLCEHTGQPFEAEASE